LGFLKTNYTQRDIGKKDHWLLKYVCSVKNNIKEKLIEKAIGFAQTDVRVNIEGIMGWIMLLKCVFIAEINLFLINITTLELAVDDVQTIKLLKKKRNVYNLTVENTPEFFANNILVHNCRYGLDSFRRRVVVQPQTDFGGVKPYFPGIG
jgi:intein/homing endonuclease